MSTSIYNGDDFKGMTVVSMISMLDTLNDNKSDKKDSIIFMTSLGTIQADEVLMRDYDFSPENDKDKIFPDYLYQIALNGRDEILKEYNNEKVLSEQTSFILKNVQIRPIGSKVSTTLPIMILFSSDVVGIALGHLE